MVTVIIIGVNSKWKNKNLNLIIWVHLTITPQPLHRQQIITERKEEKNCSRFFFLWRRKINGQIKMADFINRWFGVFSPLNTKTSPPLWHDCILFFHLLHLSLHFHQSKQENNRKWPFEQDDHVINLKLQRNKLLQNKRQILIMSGGVTCHKTNVLVRPVFWPDSGLRI